MQRDMEKNVIAVHYVTGFGDLAKFISSDIDGDTAIFRRFDHLSSRNLLYLQSELAELESLQKLYDEEDANDGFKTSNWKDIRASGRDWAAFDAGAQDINSPIHDRLQKRMALVLKIREKLKEYRGWHPQLPVVIGY